MLLAYAVSLCLCLAEVCEPTAVSRNKARSLFAKKQSAPRECDRYSPAMILILVDCTEVQHIERSVCQEA